MNQHNVYKKEVRLIHMLKFTVSILRILVLFILIGNTLGCAHTIKLSKPETNFDKKHILFNTICILPPKSEKTGIIWDKKELDKFLLKIKMEFPNYTLSCIENDSSKDKIQIQIIVGGQKPLLGDNGYDQGYVYVFLFTLGLVPYIRDFDVTTKVKSQTIKSESNEIVFVTKYRIISQLFLSPFYYFLKSEEESVSDGTEEIIQKIIEFKKENLNIP